MKTLIDIINEKLIINKNIKVQNTNPIIKYMTDLGCVQNKNSVLKKDGDPFFFDFNLSNQLLTKLSKIFNKINKDEKLEQTINQMVINDHKVFIKLYDDGFRIYLGTKTEEYLSNHTSIIYLDYDSSDSYMYFAPGKRIRTFFKDTGYDLYYQEIIQILDYIIKCYGK